jgi:hypothetical protein
MGGNEGGNSGISEFISLVLEPVAREQVGNMEINATNGLLADIVDLNAELSREREVPEVSPQEEEVGKAQELSSHEEEVSSHEEGYCPPPSQEDGNMPITGGPCHHNGGGAPHQQITTRASGQTSLQNNDDPSSKQTDIRFFLTRGGKKGENSTIHASKIQQPSFSTPQELDDPIDKMRLIRNKMVDARRAADRSKAEDAVLIRKEYKKTWMGEDLTHAKDVDNERVQDVLQLVVIGADVEALYPSLTDIEVANICFEAIMKSKIIFSNINYRKARLYIATNMNKTDQRTSPLWRVLPRRTSRGGVRPGVTASPDNEEHWFFPAVQLTE